MDRVRYVAALLVLISMPGALLYWFSIHPFVRFWRGVGARVTLALHMGMIVVVGFGMYLLRGPLWQWSTGRTRCCLRSPCPC